MRDEIMRTKQTGRDKTKLTSTQLGYVSALAKRGPATVAGHALGLLRQLLISTSGTGFAGMEPGVRERTFGAGTCRWTQSCQYRACGWRSDVYWRSCTYWNSCRRSTSRRPTSSVWHRTVCNSLLRSFLGSCRWDMPSTTRDRWPKMHRVDILLLETMKNEFPSTILVAMSPH